MHRSNKSYVRACVQQQVEPRGSLASSRLVNIEKSEPGTPVKLAYWYSQFQNQYWQCWFGISGVPSSKLEPVPVFSIA